MGLPGVVEEALFFAMGFLAALLVAIAGIPGVTRRATRLSEARARLRAPVSEKQAIAERDGLRGKHAIEVARLERGLALADEASNQLRVANGGQIAKIIALEATSADQMSLIVDQRAQIAQAELERRDLEAGLGASQIALNDAFAQRDRADVSESAAKSRQIELVAQASRDRARIAILTARGENTTGRFAELSSSAKSAADKAAAARVQPPDPGAGESRDARPIDDRLRDVIQQNNGLNVSLSPGANLDESRAKMEELESRLARSEGAREEALLESGRQLAALADREAALKAARATVATLEARLGSAGDDDALRESINRLGREVSRLFAAQRSMERQEERASGTRPPFIRRKAGTLVEPSNDERHDFSDGPERRVAHSLAPDR